MTTEIISLVLFVACIWASGWLIGYGIGVRRERDYHDWLARELGRTVAENVQLRQCLEIQRDPADFWKRDEVDE